MQDEQEFWEEALDLRRNHWLMQASNVPPNPNVVTATGMTGASPGLSFMVRYGYTDGNGKESRFQSSVLTLQKLAPSLVKFRLVN